MSDTSLPRRGSVLRRLSIVFYATLFSLTFASLSTTHFGAKWILGASQGVYLKIVAWVLAAGIQLLVVFASMLIAGTIEDALKSATLRRRHTAVILFLSMLIGLSGTVMSAGTSYVNYHQIVNNEHLEALVDLSVERMERDYQSQHEMYVQNVLNYTGLTLKQAFMEWSHWDTERRLQDSKNSPNLMGQGPRFTFANTLAEEYADYVALLRGSRPDGYLSNSRQAGELSTTKSTIAQIEEAFHDVPATIDLSSETAPGSPRQRFQHAYFVYKGALGNLANAFSKLPSPDVLRLPEIKKEFMGKQLGDRVSLVIDGVIVSNVPVPSPRPKLPEIALAPPKVPPSFQMLKDTVQEFYVGLGQTEAEAKALADREVITVGEHPWLVATARLGHMGIVEWVTLIPAVLVDLSVLLLGVVFGFATLLGKDEDPLRLTQKLSETLENIIDSLGKKIYTKPDAAGAKP